MDPTAPPEVVAAYPGVDFTVPPTVIKPVHSTKGAPAPRMRLGEALIAAGILTSDQLEACLAEQRRGGLDHTRDRRLGAVVVAQGLATESHIAEGLAAITGFDHVDPAEMALAPAVVRLLPRALAAALRIVVLEAGPTWVRVAAADPFDRRAVDAVRDASGRTSVTMAVATSASVLLALEEAWDPALDELAALAPVPAPAVPLAAGSPAVGPAPVAPSMDSGLRPMVDRGPRWELCFVGDDLPSTHPGYTPDLARLEQRLTDLGAEGWDAVSMVAGGRGMRVLLKRALYRV
ncbi:MAG TPA: hypothetical protein VNB94_04985 [Mycobacteriales bacterium]|nr:hypothetical protein [Mycobacteriales bacterium]